MGMFDNIVCEYPLPGSPRGVKEWQTKDTPAQYLDTYVIAADGTLWHVEYDVEDRSDKNATDWRSIVGCMTRVNERRVPIPNFRGAIDFYGDDENGVWWEFSALFDDGKLLNIKAVRPA